MDRIRVMIVVVVVLPGVMIFDDGLLTNQYPPNNELTSLLKPSDGKIRKWCIVLNGEFLTTDPTLRMSCLYMLSFGLMYQLLKIKGRVL